MVEITFGILGFALIIFVIMFSFMSIAGLSILILSIAVRVYDNYIKDWLDEHIGEVDDSL